MLNSPITPLFLLASVAIIVAPGPDIIYVLAKGIAQGRRPAVVAAAGFACGLSVHTTLAVLGLSALLVASALAFTVVKLVGAAYLVYLGIKAFRSQGLLTVPVGGESLSHGQIFRQAFVMNVLNPKVAIFFLAFLPQFTRPDGASLAQQLLVLGVSFALLAFLVFSTVGACSAILGNWIRARPRFARALDYVVGSVFILLGLRLALATSR
jgi:threonine/homoserine/homoserine lactone efflux protein